MRPGRGGRVPLRRWERDGLFLPAIRNWSCASRLSLRRPKIGSSHGAIRRTMRRHSKNMVHSLSALGAGHMASDNESFCCDAMADGVLMEMPFRKTFPQRTISPVFSLLTLGHSLGACPAPCGTRCSASHCVRPPGLGFQTKISLRLWPLRGEIFLRSLLRKTRLRPWERGTLASLRAGVSREQFGQIQTGEEQWHSTEIT